jgi:hypothetical protein
MFSFVECFYDDDKCHKKENTCNEYEDLIRCNSFNNGIGKFILIFQNYLILYFVIIIIIFYLSYFYFYFYFYC